MQPALSFLSLCLAAVSVGAQGVTPGSFADGGDTLVSAMMMFVGNEEKVYILDKAEGNAASINGHPAWGSVWDMATHQAIPMDVRTNVFCSSGMHLPNGSYVSFGGNQAVTVNGAPGSQVGADGHSTWDATYQDFDGGLSMRILNPCRNSDDFTSSTCQWFDEPDQLSMKSRRWYSAAEATGDGRVVIIGGMTNGGYINRLLPNTDPLFQQGAANPTYEFYPPAAGDPQVFNFMGTTSGLNAYAHSFMMPSGKMFVQANLSSVLWDFDANVETQLPPMPNGVIRVYPASGAVAMLPLTPQNNWTPTMLFCGGSSMPDADWGDYGFPVVNTWEIPASNDCQRITPEPTDGSTPQYTQDDNMLEGRTMGQFIILPTGKLLVVNGGLNGTAGYSQQTGQTSNFANMPFGESLASGPVGTPAIYDPNAAPGSRWSNAGLGASQIARLYHSSAMLLPDGSVLVAGSNPNFDVNTTTIFPTTYQAEIFYPPYFSAPFRPNVTGIPQTLSYGGNSFDITIAANSYNGSSNDAADSATVVIIRGGFTTHAMNMGQRFLQLNNTYTVNQDGSIVLHVAQLPPNPNIFQPGPAFLFVTLHGIPNNGTYLIVGNGQIGTQPTSPASNLPPNVRVDSANGMAGEPAGSGQGGSNGSGAESGSSGPKTSTALIAGLVVAGVAVIALVAGIFGAVILPRRRAAAAAAAARRKFQVDEPSYPMYSVGGYADGPATGGPVGGTPRGGYSNLPGASESAAFVPLGQVIPSGAWSASQLNFHAPYRDDVGSSRRGSAMGMSIDDPYTASPLRPSTPAR